MNIKELSYRKFCKFEVTNTILDYNLYIGDVVWCKLDKESEYSEYNKHKFKVYYLWIIKNKEVHHVGLNEIKDSFKLLRERLPGDDLNSYLNLVSSKARSISEIKVFSLIKLLNKNQQNNKIEYIYDIDVPIYLKSKIKSKKSKLLLKKGDKLRIDRIDINKTKLFIPKINKSYIINDLKLSILVPRLKLIN